jgi:hypothetical protein
VTPDQHPRGIPERHHQVYRDAEVNSHRQGRQGKPDSDRDHVPDDDGQEFALRTVQFLALPGPGVEMLVPRVRVQGGSQKADGQQRKPVHGDIHPLAAGVMQGSCDQPGRERQEDHHEQGDQVEPQEQLIDLSELVGQGGVQEPGAADGQEADDIGQVAGPRVQHLLQRRAGRMNREVQHQQRGGEPEHAVAEAFHPALAENPASARRVRVSWHCTVSLASADCGGNLQMGCPGAPGQGPGFSHATCQRAADESSR